MELIHTCYRIGEIDRSVAFYEALGFEERRRMPIRDEAINVFMGLPGDGDRLELTYNHGVDSYELGTGYNHIALTVDDLDAQLAELAKIGVEPEKPPFAPGGREEIGRICFVQDPDGYRIELIDGGEFSLSESRGQPVVVNLWASWCGPCREEFPFFQRQAIQRGGEVAFLGLLSDDTPEAGASFLEQLPLPYPSYLDPDRGIADAFQAGREFPSTLFIDASGELAFAKYGPYTDEEMLAADIDRYAAPQ